MAITRQKKEETIARLKESSQSSSLLVFLQFRGLTVARITELRNALRAVGSKYIVAKKRLMGLALKEEGTDLPQLEGEVAFVFSGEDPVGTAREIAAFAKKYKEAHVVGGIFEKDIINSAMITRLAKIPPREELLAQLVRALKGPERGLVGVMGGVTRGFVTVLRQIAEKK